LKANSFACGIQGSMLASKYALGAKSARFLRNKWERVTWRSPDSAAN
jgi:hypothetical protein